MRAVGGGLSPTENPGIIQQKKVKVHISGEVWELFQRVILTRTSCMNRPSWNLRLRLLLGAGIILLIVTTLASYPNGEGQLSARAAVLQQATASPTPEGVSEIGSTDGIVLLGFLIVLIVFVPALVLQASRRRQ